MNYSPKEIAEKLYELNEDMDSIDYEETKESDVKNIAKALTYIKKYAETNCNPICWNTLYKALEGLCD